MEELAPPKTNLRASCTDKMSKLPRNNFKTAENIATLENYFTTVENEATTMRL